MRETGVRMARTGKIGTEKNIGGIVAVQKTILVVEDDRTHRTRMEKILNECQFLTVPAENGFIALAKLETGQKFDLIIMDWDMPGLDGLETVREIRARQAEGKLPYIPVIAFTGNRKPGDRERCIAAGMDAYLPKDVLMMKWRQTLIDNLQGLVGGDFTARDYYDTGEETAEQKMHSTDDFDIDAFDIKALEQTAALLKNDLEIAVDEYLEDAATYINEIKEGIESGDIQKAAKGSHPLKSNSIGFGLIAVSQLATAINGLARDSQSPEKTLPLLQALFPKLQKAFYRAEKKLRASLKGFRP